MKRTSSLKFTLFTLLILLTLLFSAFTPSTAVRAEDQPENPAAWQFTLELDPALVDGKAALDALTAAGTKASLEGYRLTLNGDGLEDLRSLLFDTENVDYLGGSADLVLHLPAGSAPLTLALETRITSGYAWQVLTGYGYAQIGEAVLQPRYDAYGAPSIQTITLTSSARGEALVPLAYRRAFEPQAPVRARLDLYFNAAPSRLELSDPTPAYPAGTTVPSKLGTANPLNTLPEVKGLPAAWDWRTKGIVPDVRDQGGCGSCWAFGTVGIMESALKKAGGPLTDLSEQFLVSCNEDGWGCSGGLTAHHYHYDTLAKNQTKVGAVLESAKPYTATNGTCSVAYDHPYKLKNWQFVTGDEWTVPSVTAIKNAIYTYGPITSGVCVGSGFYGYTGGVFSGDDDCGGYTNHQIILVGWDDATGSWILRNSWGSYWGENGYMRIKYHTPLDPHSRVGEGTSWVLAENVAPVSIPTPISPAGMTLDDTPTFKWSTVPGATQYKLRVFKSGITTPLYTRTFNTSTCTETACSRTPAIILQPGAYNYKVSANVNNTWGAFSAAKKFTLATTKTVIDSNFNGASAPWQVHPGGIWKTSFYNYYSYGKAAAWSSTSYPLKLDNFVFEAKVKGFSHGEYGNALHVRGNPNAFLGSNYWTSGYQIEWTTDGYYSVWRKEATGERNLQPQTYSPAIKTGYEWNRVKVIAYGSRISLYFNGTKVWQGTDSMYPSGRVGFGFRDRLPGYNYRVDFAIARRILTPGFTDNEPISPEQLALNAAARQNPPPSRRLDAAKR